VPSEYQISPRSGAKAGWDIAKFARSSITGLPEDETFEGGATW
jgi:hypothetical protein